MSALETLLKTGSKERKIRTSFNLEEAPYKEFQSFCESLNLVPSDVISAFIRDFVESRKVQK